VSPPKPRRRRVSRSLRRAGQKSASKRRATPSRPRQTRAVAKPRAKKAPRKKASVGRFLVVTGMSGAGKSHAIRALEDLGYYCIDNLPTPLIPVMADLSQREDADTQKIAVVADVRERSFIREFPPMWRRLRASPNLNPTLVFLEASEASLVRRYSETRRPHPLAPDRPVTEALQQERQMLGKIRQMADQIVDTSDLTVHELRHFFLALARDRHQRQRMVVTFESFGFKHGVPLDADLVFDCRFLPNPHFVAGLRSKTGRDAPVIRYIQRYPETREFKQRVEGFLRYVVPHFVEEGKAYLTVAVGCTGGRHRSVYLAEWLKKELSNLKNVTTRVRHRDLSRDTAN
jgi:RNase adapter protein RapZ